MCRSIRRVRKNLLLDERASRIPVLPLAQKPLEVGAEASAILEAVAQVLDKFAARNMRFLGPHVVLKCCNHGINRKYCGGATQHRQLKVEKIAPFAALEERAHLGREHFVQVKGDERRGESLVAERELELRVHELEVRPAHGDIGFDLDRERSPRINALRTCSSGRSLITTRSMSSQ